jgi:hypothetical protein
MKGRHLESLRGKQEEAVRFVMLEGLFGAFQQTRFKVTGRRLSGVRLLQNGSYAGLHFSCCLVCEGEGEDLVGMSHAAQKLYEPRYKEHGFAGTSRGLHMMALGYVKRQLSGLVIRGQIHVVLHAQAYLRENISLSMSSGSDALYKTIFFR